MSAEPDIAALASLVAESARAAMLTHLLDGRSWTATELARVAGVGASTASVHLRKLVAGRLIQVSPSGRHRYFRISSAEVARLLEQLAGLAPGKLLDTPAQRRASLSLRQGRFCYDHLAGQLGVAITASMAAKGWVREEEPWYRLTEAGRDALTPLGLDPLDGRTCMDWSERRLHLAGPLGKQLAQLCIEERWVKRDPRSRAVWITPIGADHLRELFGVGLP